MSVRRCFGLFWFVLGLGSLTAALLLPTYLASVAPAAIYAAGAETSGLADAVRDAHYAGRVGPAVRLAEAAEAVGQPLADAERAALTDQLSPKLRRTGGPAPFFERFVEGAPVGVEAEQRFVPVAAIILPTANRAALREFLAESTQPAVRDLLDSRNLTGWQQFMPVTSAAGAPLDTAILSTALLAQSGQLRPRLARDIAELARQAGHGDPRALARLEQIYLAVLGLAQRLEWASLVEYLRAHEDRETLRQTASLFRRNENEQSILFAALLLSQDAAALADFARMQGEAAWPDLRAALAAGEGGLALLLAEQKPARSPPWLETIRLAQPPPAFARFTAAKPELALAAKVALMVLGGWLLWAGFKRAALARGAGASAAEFFLSSTPGAACGLFFLIILTTLLEPELFAQAVTEPGTLKLDFALNAEIAQMPPENTAAPPALDQITMVVLLIFLLVQVVIYASCLIKLAQIKQTDTYASLKLKLLENEENLFDLGLYVGLAGTVISLLMLAMGIVQASLVAAYASTLFGIIFVALLKIWHVRPLRRRYVIEAASDEWEWEDDRGKEP